MPQNRPSFGRATGDFVGHIVGIALLFAIIAAAATVLDWFVKLIEPLNVRVPYFIAILEGVATFVFYGDVVLFVVGVIVAGGLYIRDLKRCLWG